MAEELRVRVVRSGTTSARTHWVAVEFDALSLDLRHRLEQVVSLELTRASAPSVLVVDNDEWKLAHMAEQLAQHSRRALLAMSSLEAIHWLTHAGKHVALAMIGDSVSGSSSATMLEYIGSEFPAVHRATFHEPYSESALRKLLDRVEIESASHKPWVPADFG
jgi:hypothetical protein